MTEINKLQTLSRQELINEYGGWCGQITLRAAFRAMKRAKNNARRGKQQVDLTQEDIAKCLSPAEVEYHEAIYKEIERRMGG